MLKHKDIISKLSEAQKIRLLTNVGNLSDNDFKFFGISSVKLGYMKDYCRNSYPHAACLAHSWDTSLWGEVASAKAEEMLGRCVNLFVTPGARVKISPYRKEVSEDSYLAYRMAASYAESVGRLGGMCAQSGFYITEADAEWMDSTPSDRVIKEELVLPYVKAAKLSGTRAIMTDTRNQTKEYEGVPHRMRSTVGNSIEYIICEHATDENTVAMLQDGAVCLSASANAIKTALARYEKVKKQIDNGVADESRLIDDLRNNVAIAPETIDVALDKVLTFLEDCRDGLSAMRSATISKSDTLEYRSALESTVLLKNKSDLLPLSKDMRVCFIGDVNSSGVGEDSLLMKCMNSLKARGYACTGVCTGYDNYDVHNSEPKSEALALAGNSDVVVLLLGVSHAAEKDISRGETLYLPAQQLILAHELAKKGKPVVAVISDAYGMDIEFTRPFGALLLAPLESDGGAYALADIISGRCNPSGKLAYTLYAGSDTAFAKRAFYRKEYGIKSGPFVGYKYYDTAGINVGYPFGHGLSYSQFKYSSVSVSRSKISFEVKNISGTKGTEIAQIYIGKVDSSVIRPKKYLCGFTRIELEPGQTKKVSCDIELPEAIVEGERVIESGEYMVYIGASVSDIRLNKSFNVKGTKVAPDGERLIDYIQSVSNIKEDKFTLEADYKLMKKSYKNIFFGVGAIAMAIGLALFNTVMELSSTFLGIVSFLLALSSIIFFIIEARENSERHNQERERINEANKEQFTGAQTVANLGAAELFHAEFDAQDKVIAEETTQTDDYLDDKIAEHIDLTFKFSDVTAEFMHFALEKGYKFNKQSVENLFASMATSKLIVTSMADDEFNACILLLSEYFGTSAFVDTYDAGGKGDTFFTQDSKGDRVRKNVMLALAAAASAPDKIHISAIKGVKCAGINNLLKPFARYISAQREKNSIEIFNQAGANIGYTIEPNLWFVINLASGESALALPVSIARSAALNLLVFTKTKPIGTRTLTHGLNRHQLKYIAGRAIVSDISEEMWKKFDKLERFAREYSDYRIGNKLWRNFEKHISLLNSCGAELSDAADMAMAARLLASVAVVINGKQGKDDPNLMDTVEFIFGSENISASAEMVKVMLTDSKRSATNVQAQG